ALTSTPAPFPVDASWRPDSCHHLVTVLRSANLTGSERPGGTQRIGSELDHLAIGHRLRRLHPAVVAHPMRRGVEALGKRDQIGTKELAVPDGDDETHIERQQTAMEVAQAADEGA